MIVTPVDVADMGVHMMAVRRFNRPHTHATHVSLEVELQREGAVDMALDVV